MFPFSREGKWREARLPDHMVLKSMKKKIKGDPSLFLPGLMPALPPPHPHPLPPHPPSPPGLPPRAGERGSGSRRSASQAGERKHKHEIVAVIGGSENTEEMRGLYETSADKKRGDVRQPSRIRNP